MVSGTETLPGKLSLHGLIEKLLFHGKSDRIGEEQEEMATQKHQPTRLTWFSPWMIMGSVCILAGILGFLAWKNIHREKDFMEKSLLSQANMLMRSIEAGSRTGMAGMGWGKRQIQVLMEETAQQPDVLYVAILDGNGEIVAHSEPEQVGKKASMDLPSPSATAHGFHEGTDRSYDVIRRFEPWTRHRRGGRHAREKSLDCALLSYHDRSAPFYIMVGLDPLPLEKAMRQDLHQTIFLFGMMFLVGAAGFVSLVWAQHYRTVRRSLRDIEILTSTILNEMPVGLIVTDPRGRVQKVNPAAEAIFGSSWQSISRIEETPFLASILRRLGKEETIVEEELLYHPKETPAIPLLVNATIIRDSDRKPAGYAILFSDITDMKQLEDQIRRNERLASLGRLAAGIAHEIRNPLSSIKGFATIIAGRPADDPRKAQISQVMVQEVERLNRVVSELLDFARPTELDRKIQPLTAILRRSVELIESDARQRNVSVHYSVDPEDLQANVDADRFAQVLLNLFLNALQAMEAGGILKVAAFRGEGEVIVRVSDTGTGIQADSIPHIFDPYFTTKPGGVGLGLANVHKLVEAHGGDIHVESTPGNETAFVIRLPSTETLLHNGGSRL